ncbi:unnamed protein product, partial [Prorocentrum cordatum]
AKGSAEGGWRALLVARERGRAAQDGHASCNLDDPLQECQKRASQAEADLKKARAELKKARAAENKARREQWRLEAEMVPVRKAWKEEAETSKKAYKVAERNRKQARDAERKAKEGRDRAQRAEKQARLAVAITKNQTEEADSDRKCSLLLTKKVDMEVIVDNSHAMIPPGVAMFRGQADEAASEAEAHRCPNRGACVANGYFYVSLQLGCLLPPGQVAMRSPVDPDVAIAQCNAAYDSDRAGCATCASDHGRSNSDPFECSACGDQKVQLAVWMSQPIVLYAISLSGAEKARFAVNVGAAYSNDVLKILMAFSSGMVFLASSIESTDAFRALTGTMKSGASRALSTASITSGDSSGSSPAHSSSLDCLLFNGQKLASITQKLVALVLQAAIILSLALIFVAIQERSARSQAFRSRALAAFLVAGNQFLPGFVGICFQAVPCFHTQAGGKSYMAYNAAAECTISNRVQAMAVAIPALLVTVVAGPVAWVWILRLDSAKRRYDAAAGGSEDKSHSCDDEDKDDDRKDKDDNDDNNEVGRDKDKDDEYQGDEGKEKSANDDKADVDKDSDNDDDGKDQDKPKDKDNNEVGKQDNSLRFLTGSYQERYNYLKAAASAADPKGCLVFVLSCSSVYW